MIKELTDIDKAIFILEKTRDGDDLDPKLLGLVELAVNGRLNNVGKDAFEGLYKEVMGRIYRRPWFHNVENLVIDHEGFVYWKGNKVEHFTLRWAYTESARKQAVELGRRCKILESKGIVPSTDNAVLELERVVFQIWRHNMSITLSKVEYTYFGSITSEFADFLDSIASDVTPTRMHLSMDDNYRISRLNSYAKSHPDEADSVEYILKDVEKNGKIDIAWG